MESLVQSGMRETVSLSLLVHTIETKCLQYHIRIAGSGLLVRGLLVSAANDTTGLCASLCSF